MNATGIPPADPAPVTTTAVLAMHAGHLCPPLSAGHIHRGGATKGRRFAPSARATKACPKGRPPARVGGIRVVDGAELVCVPLDLFPTTSRAHS